MSVYCSQIDEVYEKLTQRRALLINRNNIGNNITALFQHKITCNIRDTKEAFKCLMDNCISLL